MFGLSRSKDHVAFVRGKVQSFFKDSIPVRIALMDNFEGLYPFFNKQVFIEDVFELMTAFLGNDRYLRASFFRNCGQIGAFIGSALFEMLCLPLIKQSLYG